MRWHALRVSHVPGMHDATSNSKITILPSLKLTFFLYFSPHEECVMGVFWSTVRHWQAIFGHTWTADGLTVMPAVNYDGPHHPSPSRWLGISPESDHYNHGCDCATLSYSTVGTSSTAVLATGVTVVSQRSYRRPASCWSFSAATVWGQFWLIGDLKNIIMYYYYLFVIPFMHIYSSYFGTVRLVSLIWFGLSNTRLV